MLENVGDDSIETLKPSIAYPEATADRLLKTRAKFSAETASRLRTTSKTSSPPALLLN